MFKIINLKENTLYIGLLMKMERKHSEMLSRPNTGDSGPTVPDKYESSVVLLHHNQFRMHILVQELPNKEYGNMDPADLDNSPMITVS
jgi:hypothetical protein